MTIKDENYINIQGWMVTELKLKGNELLIYGLIYGFSQAEGQVYNGGLQYLADWTNATKQGVIKNLKSLVEKGYIGKNEKVINNIKFCEYYATKFNGAVNKVEQGSQQSLTDGGQQSLTNNEVNNNTNDNENNNKKERKKAVQPQGTSYQEIIDESFTDESIKELMWEFIKMRQMKKKPLTDRALKIQINKLNKISKDINIQKAVIERAIVRTWDEFYPINDYNAQPQFQPQQTPNNQSTGNFDYVAEHFNVDNIKCDKYYTDEEMENLNF